MPFLHLSYRFSYVHLRGRRGGLCPVQGGGQRGRLYRFIRPGRDKKSAFVHCGLPVVVYQVIDKQLVKKHYHIADVPYLYGKSRLTLKQCRYGNPGIFLVPYGENAVCPGYVRKAGHLLIRELSAKRDGMAVLR